MKVVFLHSFLRDLRKVRQMDMRLRVKDVIEAVEQAERLLDLSSVKKLRGEDAYYRIRVGDYRIGLKMRDETVIFVRFLHRRDIYRYFP